MAGVPIRLVRKDGNTLELNCTDYEVKLTRSVVVIPVPLTAERVGADLNMVQAEIVLECLIVDDDCSSITAGKSYSKASIDFGIRANKEGDSVDVVSWLDGDDGGSTTISELDDAVFTITSTDETDFTVTLKNGSASSSGTNVEVNISNVDGAVEMAAAIKTAMEGLSAFTDKITPSLSATDNASVGGNGKLVLTQVTSGSDGATATPSFVAGSASYNPKIRVFDEVSDTGCLSAGDKVQNIMSTVGNNSLLGAMGKVGQFKGVFDEGIGGEFVLGEASKKSDYIIGLRLPYNSLYEASLSNAGDPVAGYNVRNLLLVTGGHMPTNLKNVESNTLPASGADNPFDFSDKHTGISGTITTASIKYDAGSTIYRATLSFQPLDLIGAI